MTSLTALSSFPGSSRRVGDSRQNDSIGSSSKEFSLQSSLTPNTIGSKNEMIIRGGGQQQSVSSLEIYNQDGAESVTSEQQLALRIDKETKPHHHLLRLLKEMDLGDDTSDPTKGEAVASLIGDFERDVSLIEQKIENEKLLKDSAENPPPLPANWIALECPQTGDVYYANEETGDTTWDRPGLDNEQNAYLNESAQTNDTGSEESRSDDENEDDKSYNDAGSLPPDWIALEDPDSGDTYYANEVTGETTWDRPESHQDYDEGDNLEHENEQSNSSNTFTVQNEEESVSSSGHNNDNHNNSYNPQSLVSEEDGHNESYNLEQASSTDFNQSGQSSVEVDDDDENLPPGWYSAIDPDSNERYYCNDETGESQWERPEFPVTDETSQGSSQHNGDNHDESYNDDEDDVDDDEEEAIGELPEGWEAILDPSTGDYYYYNWEDGTTTWDKPASDDSNQGQEQATTTENDNGLPEHWFAVDDPASGDTYYYNEVTNETSWDKPGADAETNNLIVYEEDSVTSSKY